MTEPTPRTHVIRHRSRHGRWEAAFGDPDARLSRLVRGYLGYVENTTRFEYRREIPTGDVALILQFGSSRVRAVDPRERSSPAEYRSSFIAGPDDGYTLSETGGTWRGVQVDFTPIGAYRFFGLPMYELTRRVVDLEDVFGSPGRRLVARLEEAPDWERRFAVLDAVITRRLAENRRPTPGVVWAWNQLRASEGRLRISRLTTELGYSRKRLNARFREEIGLSPKRLASLVRFHHVLRRLDDAAQVSWADVAFDGGYYDQAHLIKDFRRFTGLTPRQFLARRLPDRGGVVGD